MLVLLNVFFLEQKILDSDRSNPRNPVHSELIRLSEKEKDQILNSMALCVETVFR